MGGEDYLQNGVKVRVCFVQNAVSGSNGVKNKGDKEHKGTSTRGQHKEHKEQAQGDGSSVSSAPHDSNRPF